MHKKKDLTDKEREILRCFSRDGFLTGYYLWKTKHLMSNKTAYSSLKRLASLGLAEKKGKEGRDRKTYKKKNYYGLTFHGLLFAMNINLFTASEAATVRLRNHADVPEEQDLAVMPMAMQDSESDVFPSTFLKALFPNATTEALQTLLQSIASKVKPLSDNITLEMRKIMVQARRHGKNPKMFSMIEQNYSQRIYTKLRAVNPDPEYFNVDVAALIYADEHRKCAQEFFVDGFLKPKQEAANDIANCLDDPYSAAVVRKVILSSFADMIPLIKKGLDHLLEFETEKEIREYNAEFQRVHDAFKELSSMTQGDLQNEVRKFPANLAQIKKLTKKLSK